MITLHVRCLINRTTFALWKNSKNLFVFQKVEVSKTLLFSSVDGLYSNMQPLVHTGECGAVVTHGTSNMSVSPCKSLNPSLCLLFLWKTEVIYSQR